MGSVLSGRSAGDWAEDGGVGFLGGGDWGQWGGRVLLVLRIRGVLVILLLVAVLVADGVEALPGVAFVAGEEVAQVQGACGFTS